MTTLSQSVGKIAPKVSLIILNEFPAQKLKFIIGWHILSVILAGEKVRHETILMTFKHCALYWRPAWTLSQVLRRFLCARCLCKYRLTVRENFVRLTLLLHMHFMLIEFETQKEQRMQKSIDQSTQKMTTILTYFRVHQSWCFDSKPIFFHHFHQNSINLSLDWLA